MEKKLTKSNNKMLAGVCAGLAEYFNIDATLVRVGYVFASFLFGACVLGLFLYILLCIIMPNPDAQQ